MTRGKHGHQLLPLHAPAGLPGALEAVFGRGTRGRAKRLVLGLRWYLFSLYELQVKTISSPTDVTMAGHGGRYKSLGGALKSGVSVSSSLVVISGAPVHGFGVAGEFLR